MKFYTGMSYQTEADDAQHQYERSDDRRDRADDCFDCFVPPIAGLILAIVKKQSEKSDLAMN